MFYWRLNIFSFRCRFLNDLLKHAAEENILAHELLEPYLCNTALIQASREHRSSVVEELLSKGADVHISNSAGNVNTKILNK